MPTYTNSTLVNERCTDISLSGAAIDNNIIVAEGIMDAVMRTDFKTNFSGSKLGIIQDTATALAAYLSMTNDVGGTFDSTAAAALTADMLWADADRGLAILSDQRTVTYLKTLI